MQQKIERHKVTTKQMKRIKQFTYRISHSFRIPAEHDTRGQYQDKPRGGNI